GSTPRKASPARRCAQPPLARARHRPGARHRTGRNPPPRRALARPEGSHLRRPPHRARGRRPHPGRPNPRARRRRSADLAVPLRRRRAAGASHPLGHRREPVARRRRVPRRPGRRPAGALRPREGGRLHLDARRGGVRGRPTPGNGAVREGRRRLLRARGHRPPRRARADGPHADGAPRRPADRAGARRAGPNRGQPPQHLRAADRPALPPQHPGGIRPRPPRALPRRRGAARGMRHLHRREPHLRLRPGRGSGRRAAGGSGRQPRPPLRLRLDRRRLGV
ncbi:MAG: Sulfur oxidation protein SoxY, partial [uncultured Acetobacteraceae bacterium]